MVGPQKYRYYSLSTIYKELNCCKMNQHMECCFKGLNVSQQPVGRPVFLVDLAGDLGWSLDDDQGRSPTAHWLNPVQITGNSLDIQ